jgi:hypothetical protein
MGHNAPQKIRLSDPWSTTFWSDGGSVSVSIKVPIMASMNFQGERYKRRSLILLVDHINSTAARE